MLEPVDEHFVEQVRRLAPGSARTDDRARPPARAVRRTAPESAPRPRRALAAVAGRRLLDDRVGWPREQRGPRAADTGRRSGPPALPLGRLLRRPRRPERGRAPDHATNPVRDVLLGLPRPPPTRSPGPAQGLGHPALRVIPQTSTIASHLPRAVGLAFALGNRAALAPTALAGRRPRGLQLRRRLGEPLDGAGRAQRGGVAPTAGCDCRCSWSARTTASGSTVRRRAGWRRRSRRLPGIRVRRRGVDRAPTGSRRSRSRVDHVRHAATAGAAAPADGAVPRPRRLRRRARLPLQRRDRARARRTRCSRPRRTSSSAGTATEEVLARYESDARRGDGRGEVGHRRAPAREPR